MRLLIDGDGCPDRKEVIDLACHYGIETILFIDFYYCFNAFSEFTYSGVAAAKSLPFPQKTIIIGA